MMVWENAPLYTTNMMISILQLHIMVYGACFWGILVFDHLSDHVSDHLFDHTTHACMNRGQKQDPENQQKYINKALKNIRVRCVLN